MASTLDIAPALGHGLVTAQGQPGGYDAIDDRRQWAVGRMEGYVRSGAYKVTQRAEGANPTIDVAAHVGPYLVRGDDVSWQGLYLVPPLPLKANLSLEQPPDPTNPRVDQIVLEARDDAHRHDGITRARLYVLTGTPTSGATVVDSAAYLASRAVLPPSTAPLAEVVVRAGASTILTSDIRDVRTSALMRSAIGPATANITTASTTTYTAWPSGPTIKVHEPGLYLVEANARIQQQTNVLTAGRFGISLNGDAPPSDDGSIADFIGSTAFDAATLPARRLVEAVAGDVISLRCASNNVAVQFGAVTLIARPVG